MTFLHKFCHPQLISLPIWWTQVQIGRQTYTGTRKKMMTFRETYISHMYPQYLSRQKKGHAPNKTCNVIGIIYCLEAFLHDEFIPQPESWLPNVCMHNTSKAINFPFFFITDYSNSLIQIQILHSTISAGTLSFLSHAQNNHIQIHIRMHENKWQCTSNKVCCKTCNADWCQWFLPQVRAYLSFQQVWHHNLANALHILHPL